MPGIHEPLTEQLLDGAYPAADPYPLARHVAQTEEVYERVLAARS